MKNEILYQDELINIYCKIHKCYDMKIRTLQCLRINYYLNRFVKLNKKTHNKNIDEIINIIGEIKISYEKNCEKNNYYIESYIPSCMYEIYDSVCMHV